MYGRERKSERGKDSGRNRQNREYGLSELGGDIQSFLEHVCKLTMSNNSWVSTKGVTVTIGFQMHQDGSHWNTQEQRQRRKFTCSEPARQGIWCV